MVRRGRARWDDRERGVSAIEFVLLTPLLFFLLFGTVQFALYFYARHVAIAAAQEGDRVAREERADPNENWSSDAVAKANDWIGQLAPSLLAGSGVNAGESGPVGRDGWTVSVTVSVPPLLSWGGVTVTETSSGPVEQFIQDTGN